MAGGGTVTFGRPLKFFFFCVIAAILITDSALYANRLWFSSFWQWPGWLYGLGCIPYVLWARETWKGRS